MGYLYEMVAERIAPKNDTAYFLSQHMSLLKYNVIGRMTSLLRRVTTSRLRRVTVCVRFYG